MIRFPKMHSKNLPKKNNVAYLMAGGEKKLLLKFLVWLFDNNNIQILSSRNRILKVWKQIGMCNNTSKTFPTSY